MYKELPAGYSLFDIIADLDWMSLVSKALNIGTVKIGWPGNIRSPIAMIDTGGRPTSLSDPGGHLSDRTWPDEVPNPVWVGNSVGNCACSTNCTSTQTDIAIWGRDRQIALSPVRAASFSASSLRSL